MGEIDFTNIIIDDFRKGKLNPFNKYIYILTHIHSDHLRGLSNSWEYGPIYCSQVTANLLLNKYPKLVNNIRVMSVEQPHQIILAQNISVTVTFFDANHCAGAVMVLLQGYFGRFLYTGDFRFDRKKFSTYSYLYPGQNLNANFQGCSRHIDKMWVDNTFCNPRFKFMAQKQALEVVLDFVKTQSGKRIYVGMDYYGKQQVLIHIAQQLDTIIVVDEQRYENIIAMQFDRELFTTNPQEGFIQIVQKPKLHDKLLDNPQAIGLVMSGWSLQCEWRKVKGSSQARIYYVPYSLHSNFQQLTSFLKSVKPSMIQPIVSVSESSQSGKISNESMYNTQGNAETFNNLVKAYSSPISETYMKNLQDKEFQEALKKRFGFDRKSMEINKSELKLNTVYVPPRGRGYKIGATRDQQQINRVKQQFKKSRAQRRQRIRMTEEVVINDSSENQDSSEIQVIQRQQMMDQYTRPKIKSEKQNTIQNNIKVQNNPQAQANKQKQKQIHIPKPDWQQLNKIQFIQGEKMIEEHFKCKIKEILTKMI